jgi:hypothetical protein
MAKTIMKAGREILVGGIMVKEKREIQFGPVLCGNEKKPEESIAVNLGSDKRVMSIEVY